MKLQLGIKYEANILEEPKRLFAIGQHKYVILHASQIMVRFQYKIFFRDFALFPSWLVKPK